MKQLYVHYGKLPICYDKFQLLLYDLVEEAPPKKPPAAKVSLHNSPSILVSAYICVCILFTTNSYCVS